MATSRATTVDAYLAELPPPRREAIAAVREVVLRHLPDGYDEVMAWGMIAYELPLARYPDTYNGRPLCYAALAAQKQYNSLYLMSVYQDARSAERFAEEYAAAGKTLRMGKSCLRFKELDELPLDLIGRVIASTPPEAFIARYEAARR